MCYRTPVLSAIIPSRGSFGAWKKMLLGEIRNRQTTGALNVPGVISVRALRESTLQDVRNLDGGAVEGPGPAQTHRYLESSLWPKKQNNQFRFSLKRNGFRDSVFHQRYVLLVHQNVRNVQMAQKRSAALISNVH